MIYKKIISLTYVLLFSVSLLFGQDRPVCKISTDNTDLVYAVDGKGRLMFRYYGQKTVNESDFRKIKNYDRAGARRYLGYEAYPGNGQGYTNEPAISLIHSDGSIVTELVYLSYEEKQLDPNRKLYTIHLKDKKLDLSVTLYTESYMQEDVICQWVSVTNNEDSPVSLRNVYSSFINLRASEYYLTHFDGYWAGEMNRIEEKLRSGIKSIESRKGVRTTQTENPSFVISLDQPANEDHGRCYGGSLAWSGNYKLIFEVDEYSFLNILSGTNPFLSDWALAKGESFETPKMIYTFSNEGQTRISHNFHDWSRKYALHNGEKERPVILNSWEGAYFDFTEETLTKMMDDAAELGIEMFVLDDGWFGNKYPRNADNAGLGDWQVNKKKLPNGIKHLADYATKKGIKFGIWIEPEMVNPKSELFERHPEWIVESAGRERTTLRDQLILDLSNPDVQNFIWNTIDKLLSDNPGISYIKWDTNRNVEQVGSNYLPHNKQTHFWIEYTKGLYNIYGKIREKYPDLMIQLCSSGGGKLDFKALSYHDEFWASDNTDPLKRVFIQYSTNIFFPALATGAHVSTSPNHQTGRMTPLKFRFDVAMSGRLGFELRTQELKGKDREFAIQVIKDYKEHIRPVITEGDLYRLISPYNPDNTYASSMYVTKNKTKAVLFVYCTESTSREIYPLLKLKGLNPDKQYRIREINKTGQSCFWGNEDVFSGDFLMNAGIELRIHNQFESGVFVIEEV